MQRPLFDFVTAADGLSSLPAEERSVREERSPPTSLVVDTGMCTVHTDTLAVRGIAYYANSL